MLWEEKNVSVYKYPYDLASDILPTPTIKGVIGSNSRVKEDWFTEVQRNGYIQAVYRNIQNAYRDSSKFRLDKGYIDLFRAFCDFCEEIWEVTQTDIPYLFRCNYFNAKDTIFLVNLDFNEYTNPYNKRSIVWTEQVRQVGESLDSIYRAWTEQLFNAFGLDLKAPE